MVGAISGTIWLVIGIFIFDYYLFTKVATWQGEFVWQVRIQASFNRLRLQGPINEHRPNSCRGGVISTSQYLVKNSASCPGAAIAGLQRRFARVSRNQSGNRSRRPICTVASRNRGISGHLEQRGDAMYVCRRDPPRTSLPPSCSRRPLVTVSFSCKYPSDFWMWPVIPRRSGQFARHW